MRGLKTRQELDSSFLKPVVRTTLTADVCREMISHLISGDWHAGEKIPAERELSQRLGVGRASLREALKALEIMGMIETRLGDGTYVCERSEFLSRPLLWAIASSSETDARELIEARMLIEVELAGLAAERATSIDLKAIAEHLACMENAKGSPADFVKADVGFHLAIGRAAANSILMNALELIRNLLQQWILSAAQITGLPDKACQQHRQLLLAIKSKDSSAARKAMRRHLNDMALVLLEKNAQATIKG